MLMYLTQGINNLFFEVNPLAAFYFWQISYAWMRFIMTPME